MPKTSKKSKASKRTGLRKRFDLSNKKVQFFAVIGIVAVLGGGWFTYKSFAATGDGYSWGPSNMNCTSGKCQKISDPAKNNATVVLLNNYSGQESSVSFNNPSFWTYTQNRNHKVCVSAKGTGTVHVMENALRTGNHDINSIKFSDNNSYQTKCRTVVLTPDIGTATKPLETRNGYIQCGSSQCNIMVRTGAQRSYVTINSVSISLVQGQPNSSSK